MFKTITRIVDVVLTLSVAIVSAVATEAIRKITK